MRTVVADFKSLIAFLLLPMLAFAQAGGDGLPDVTLTLAPGGKGGTREFVDLPVKADAFLKGVLSFDLTVSDPAAVSRYVCYVRCGMGWYYTPFEPTQDEAQANKAYSVNLTTVDIAKVEGRPEGWRKADRLRFAVYRMSSRPCVIKIANLAFKPAAKDALFVRDSTRSRMASEARAAKIHAQLAAMPGRAGERRLLWCHSAWGMCAARNWDETCRFAKENGFTDLLVNLAWGGCAFYPSKVLLRAEQGPRGDALAICQAACRKYGLKLHVWKVCWNQGAKASSSFRAAMQTAGRCCVSRSGKVEPQWNCPSHPANRQLEIDAMVELALEKGVDGIHFDYIRYKAEAFCFCDGCRTRFEKQVGRRVARWPQDVERGGPLNDAWTRFRCGNIAAVVKTVAEKVKKVRPETEISAAVFPHFDTTGVERGQDWLSWCRAGWLDFVCPMDYFDRPERFAACIHAQREALKGTSAKFYPGLAFECAAYGRIDAWAPAQEILEVRKAGLDGFTVFHLGPYAEEILPQLRKGPLK